MSSQYLLVIYLLVIDMDNLGMVKIDELRKKEAERHAARLDELIRTRFEKQSDFINLINGNQGEISALSSIPPKKSFGAMKARKIEQDAGLLPNALDAELGSPFYQHELDPTIRVAIEPLISASPDVVRDNIDSASFTQPERLRQALGHIGLTPPVLAAVAGVSEETAALWLGGIGPELSLVHAVALQNTYGVNSVWLIKGKGSPGVAIRHADDYRPITDLKWRGVPVVGFAQLGDNGHFVDIEYPVGYGDGHVRAPSEDKDAYALRCVGDSMTPRIKDREFVVVEPNHPIEPGDEVLVKSRDGRVMVKEFLYKRAGRVHLVSVNAAHPPIAIDENQIEKMHYVGWIAKPSAWRPE